MASRMPFRQDPSPERNIALSLQRARAVERAIMTVIMEEMRRRGASGVVVPPQIDTSVAGVGTAFSTEGDFDRNDPRHRAVLLVPGRVAEVMPEMRVTPPVPALAPATEFWIKYVGGASISLIVPDGTAVALMIRDPNGYSQDYAYAGIGGGVSAPIAFAEALPPGQGWVRFTTARPYLVSSFGGSARVGGGGVQVGAGWSVMLLEFGLGRAPGHRPVSVGLPSGSGFTLGVGADIAGRMWTVGEVARGRWRFF